METTQNFKTFTLDFAYDTDTFAEALDEMRSDCPYAVINPTGELANGWPVVEAIVPADLALEFIARYHGIPADEALALMED
jgi:hypothetical protein